MLFVLVYWLKRKQGTQSDRDLNLYLVQEILVTPKAQSSKVMREPYCP